MRLFFCKKQKNIIDHIEKRFKSRRKEIDQLIAQSKKGQSVKEHFETTVQIMKLSNERASDMALCFNLAEKNIQNLMESC
jgi:hypothetical protein